MQPRPFQQIARDVLNQKLVVGQVGIERSDDVVAVLERVGNVVVELMPARFGIPDQIEPMPRPALTEVRRVEELVYGSLIGRRLSVALSLLPSVLRRWRDRTK